MAVTKDDYTPRIICIKVLRIGSKPYLPALKNYGLDPANLLNYRPIANVTFPKSFKRSLPCSSSPIQREIICCRQVNPVSEIRRQHSTETLLIQLSDICGEIDKTQLTLLALFDVSAALNTVDHEILLERLCVSFGLCEDFNERMSSFLNVHSLCVVHGSTRSLWVPALFELLQGSVLGPILYTLIPMGLPHSWLHMQSWFSNKPTTHWRKSSPLPVF